MSSKSKLFGRLVVGLVVGVLGTVGFSPAIFAHAPAIIIDCNTDDWAGISPLGYDCNEDVIPDDGDLKAGYATHDADNLYLRLDVYGNINISGINEYYIYLDTDQSSSTGFTGTRECSENPWTTGADYRVLLNQWDKGLQKFMGENQSDDKWGWGGVPGIKPIPIEYCGGTIECAVPKVDIGETKEYDEATNIMFRIHPGCDAIPYYDVLPLTHYCSARRLSNDLVIDNFEYLTDSELNSVYSVELDPGTSLVLKTTLEDCWQGSYCTEMIYSLNDVWSMVRAVRYLDVPEDWSRHKNISLWVKGYSGCIENFLVYIIESDGDEWFYQSDKVLVNDAWTKVIIPLAELKCDIYRDCNGDRIKTLEEVVGYRIAIHDITDDGSSPTGKSIYVDNFIRKDGSLSLPPHPIPDVNNYAVYYGVGRVKDLSKFDLVIIQPGENYTAKEITRIKENGTIVLMYVSVGEQGVQIDPETCEPEPPYPGDGMGPISSGVLTYKGCDSRYIDECTQTIQKIEGNCKLVVDCNQNDGIPDRNATWGGYFINAGNKGWQDDVITLIDDIINSKGTDGVFLDTIGVPEEYIAGRKPYEWTTPGMISMIAAIEKAYPDIYIMGNRGFYLFEYFEEYVNALMFESFTSSHKSFINCDNVIYTKWDECNLSYTANIANQVNTIRGHPCQTTINVFALDYSAIDSVTLIEEDYARAKKFGFVPSVSDVCLSKLYMVNPANDLLAARVGSHSVALSWHAIRSHVMDANLACYIIKRSTDGPIDTDEKWANADLVSDCVPSSDTSFTDDTAPPGHVYYAIRAVKVGGMSLVGRVQSSCSPIAVDGYTSDWEWLGIPPLVSDPPDDFISEGGNENVDIEAGYATNDANNLYLRFDVYGNIDRIGTQYFVYLDTDQDKSTGFNGFNSCDWAIGADYRVFVDQFNMGLQKFVGPECGDDIWSWDGVPFKHIAIDYKAGTIEFAVPRVDIGEHAPGEGVNLLWRAFPGNDYAPFYDTVAEYVFGEEIPPARPTRLRIKASFRRKIRLHWRDNSDNEYGFIIERKRRGCKSRKLWKVIATVPPNTTRYTDRGLKPNTRYSYRVRAYNCYGDSDYSNCKAARTLP